jgi:hypothetical protein
MEKAEGMHPLDLLSAFFSSCGREKIKTTEHPSCFELPASSFQL